MRKLSSVALSVAWMDVGSQRHWSYRTGAGSPRRIARPGVVMSTFADERSLMPYSRHAIGVAKDGHITKGKEVHRCLLLRRAGTVMRTSQEGRDKDQDKDRGDN